ncbi:hypothetical protein [Roseomonas indoligenes]|uniref:Uncharacterized protein n=1 Tax=Roseomonas indoligenes TaxID=2820811 RepID=A0A940MYN6_9PROT|nr:hypothetical protein [Pararoseomonas indoligenes]MBP0495769.1 hypothetical protein [Pararoseomonas indoligenes]
MLVAFGYMLAPAYLTTYRIAKALGPRWVEGRQQPPRWLKRMAAIAAPDLKSGLAAIGHTPQFR